MIRQTCQLPPVQLLSRVPCRRMTHSLLKSCVRQVRSFSVKPRLQSSQTSSPSACRLDTVLSAAMASIPTIPGHFQRAMDAPFLLRAVRAPGSGIVVAANLVAVAIGTETSGSILSPGSSNGVVGIKSTVGLVSRSGILPITADQDTAGPLARTVTDAAILLGEVAGHDPNDSATNACLIEGNCHSDYTKFLNKHASRRTHRRSTRALLDRLHGRATTDHA